MFKYFRFASVTSLLAFAALWYYTRSVEALYLALVLAAVEIAVSFDNAVVNATKLHLMNKFWRTAFLTVGILVAVIGMRFFLPLLIVAILGDTSIGGAYTMATTDPDRFSTVLSESASQIHGFGGAFLMMVGLQFFLDHEKDHHWIPILEKPLAHFDKFIKMGKVEGIEAIIVLGISGWIWSLTDDLAFFIASAFGVITFIVVDAIKSLLEELDSWLATSSIKILSGGLGTFLYLECLDSAFSGDGVIAAFAISKDIFVIATGLGIGALFVRSMTIMLDETGTLKALKYMENGAFFAILALAGSMFAGAFVHLPEWSIALASILCIGGAAFHSWIVDRPKKVIAV